MAENAFKTIFDALYDHYGPQYWWPAESSLEMIVGAILTQNTQWRNVEKALANLKKKGLLSLPSLLSISTEELAQSIRSAGYYNVKAKRLQNLLRMIESNYAGDIDTLCDDDMNSCRNNLLSVKGVGEETADSILLYCCRKPVFVVDKYTHRVFSRHGLVPDDTSYAEIQQQFMSSLPMDESLFNEYHALIVRVAKDYCKKQAPACDFCPLSKMLSDEC